MEQPTKKMIKKGLFVVFEGLDRSGKSTQSRMLTDYIENCLSLPVRKINYPDRNCTTGKIINDYLKSTNDMTDEAIHLLFSMNRWEQYRQLKDELTKEGTNLVCDRYAFSGVAYTAAKGIDFNWCLNADRGLIQPDIVFYIDIDKETIQKRAGFGDERYEKADFQEKVREQYKLFENFYAQDDKPSIWHTLDGRDKSVDELHEEIKVKVNEFLQSKQEQCEDELNEQMTSLFN